ncbi:MAG: DUF1549 and DUF1553 domain-containing protein [Verrucomicrobiae bacterium]|nr:DUF1549 and DUF1553 domain-containing protein [Verrucomicrobiae bacterium]
MKFLQASAMILVAATVEMVAATMAPSVFEGRPAGAAETPIDKLVFGQLARLGIQPAHLCSDAVFVRRAYLDVIGTLPTMQEAKAFIADSNPHKRSALIDRLLERPEFADYWAMKWSDLLRIKAEFPINLWPNAAQAYHRWVRTAIKQNMPYDQFVRELLTASGSNFREGQVNFYRAMQNKSPEGIATTVALTFMGSRAEFWPKEYLPGMAMFFTQIGYKDTAEWKEQIVFWDPNAGAKSAGTNAIAPPAGADAPQMATFPDGTRIQLPPDRDPREVFADWLITPTNLWFTVNISNRVWSWLLGRGIIHEPDDIRSNNPASNYDLLAYLQKELIAAKYDLKHLYRLILNSKTYQLSSIPRSNDPRADIHFARYPIRRLEAEVLIDALNQITGTSEKYVSAIPEPFTNIPENVRSIALPDGSISSPYLELFGRPPRDTGLEAERSNRPSAAQRLHFLNSSHVQRKIEDSAKLRDLLRTTSRGQARDPIDALYLTILSRYPTDSELGVIGNYFRAASNRANAMNDIVWALINTEEFLHRH